jgi:hypothetical protein
MRRRIARQLPAIRSMYRRYVKTSSSLTVPRKVSDEISLQRDGHNRVDKCPDICLFFEQGRLLNDSNQQYNRINIG